MKLFLSFLFILALSQTHAQKRGQTYISALLHDMKQPGGSLVTSFNLTRNIGLGAGVDVSSYNRSIIAPAYIDLRFKKEFDHLTPFLIGQIGFTIYNRTDGTGIYTTDISGGNRKEIMLKKSGQLTYAGGLGINHKIGKVQVYISGLLRTYQFKNQTHNVGGKEISYNNSETITVINAGVIF